MTYHLPGSPCVPFYPQSPPRAGPCVPFYPKSPPHAGGYRGIRGETRRLFPMSGTLSDRWPPCQQVRIFQVDLWFCTFVRISARLILKTITKSQFSQHSIDLQANSSSWVFLLLPDKARYETCPPRNRISIRSVFLAFKKPDNRKFRSLLWALYVERFVFVVKHRQLASQIIQVSVGFINYYTDLI